MRLALFLCILPVLPASAAIRTCQSAHPIADAEVVVQIAELQVRGPDSEGLCTLAGPVVRSFSGPVPLGALVQVTFFCGSGSQEAGVQTSLGPLVLYDVAEVARAPVAEVHATLDAVIMGGGDSLLLLDAPTEKPAVPFDDLRALGDRC